jgi:hypothetical protein
VHAQDQLQGMVDLMGQWGDMGGQEDNRP